MFEETQEQLEFHSKLELWSGPIDRKLFALKFIEGVRLQGEHICLELIDDDGDEAEFAISIAELVKMHGDFIKYSHPTDAEESKAEVLKALRDAIAAIELQHSEPEAWAKPPNAKVTGSPALSASPSGLPGYATEVEK